MDVLEHVCRLKGSRGNEISTLCRSPEKTAGRIIPWMRNRTTVILLILVIEHLSVRAKYFRFRDAHKKNLSERELDRFTATNAPDHVAVGTLLIGTADPEPDGIGEFIVLVHRESTAMLGLLGHFDRDKTSLGGVEIVVRFPVTLNSDQTAAPSW
jgi:hypothetical protein